jgi:hypothetical protein
MSHNPKFDRTLKAMADLHNSKLGDYASTADPYSNFAFAAEFSQGFTDPLDRVFATLIGVKVARLIELTKPGRTPTHESVQDTRRDLANYAAIWASYFDTEPAVSAPLGTGLKFR